MLTYHHQFLALVEYFYQFSYQAVLGLLMVCLILDGNSSCDGIANVYGSGKAQALVSVGHRHFIDHLRCKANAYRENERAVRYALFERLCFAPFFIHVVRKEITGLSCMQHNVRLGNRSAEGGALFARLKFVEVFFQEHTGCCKGVQLKRCYRSMQVEANAVADLRFHMLCRFGEAIGAPVRSLFSGRMKLAAYGPVANVTSY
jgi:hypothetical protein